MEIIKRGVLPADRYWVGECNTCKSVVRAKESELKNIDNGDQRSEGPFSWEQCPVCRGTSYRGICFHLEKVG